MQVELRQKYDFGNNIFLKNELGIPKWFEMRVIVPFEDMQIELWQMYDFGNNFVFLRNKLEQR